MKIKSLISVIILSNKYFCSIKLIIGFLFVIIILTTSTFILNSKKYLLYFYWTGINKIGEINPTTASGTATTTNGFGHHEKNLKIYDEKHIVIRRKLQAIENTTKEEYIDYSEEFEDKGHANFVGATCNTTCNHQLKHVTCDPIEKRCKCKKKYPAEISPTEGCTQAKQLGEQCNYHVSCQFNDDNSFCAQVKYKAVCQCIEGFHSVSYSRKGSFCTHDISKISNDLPTVFGVGAGIAVLAGLICMVLHLFSKTKYPRHRRFNGHGINSTPPVMYSSTTDIPLAVQTGRPTSRQSFYSNNSSKSSRNRRSSSAPHARYDRYDSRDILVTSFGNIGSRRPSLTSVYSQNSASVRSYSALRFEKEIQQKEIRQEMRERLNRLQHIHSIKKQREPSTSQTFVAPNLEPRVFTSAPTSPTSDIMDGDVNSITSTPICLNIKSDID